MNTAMDFKAASLKSQPCTAVVNTLKPTAGDVKLGGKKEQNPRPIDSFNASGDDGRINIVKVGRPLFISHLATLRITEVPSESAHETAPDGSTLPSRRIFDFDMLPTIIETGPTPPMTSASPCVEAWSYVSPQGRPAVRRGFLTPFCIAPPSSITDTTWSFPS